MRGEVGEVAADWKHGVRPGEANFHHQFVLGKPEQLSTEKRTGFRGRHGVIEARSLGPIL
jgi:hypothetical protein